MSRAWYPLAGRRLRPGWLVVALLAPILTGCNDGGASPISPTPTQGLSIEAVASSMEVDGVAGIARDGLAPAPGNGPQITLSGNDSIINGGTLSVAVTADRAFTTLHLFVAVPSEGVAGSAPGVADGYYELQLPAAQTSATVLLTFPQEIALESIDLRFAAAAGGVVGPYESLPVDVIQVGAGDLQVTLSWDADSDIDLHVVAPGGTEIFYGNRQAAGGTLDLDSNAGCSIDGTRNENITWPRGAAPAGTYVVRVDNWSSCGLSRTNYTVRINNGGNVQVFTGSFTDPGSRGGAGSGVTIATFTRSSGSSITGSLVPATPSQWLNKNAAEVHDSNR